MYALTYERRRLTGIRSTWLILLTVLLVDAVIAALTVRQPALAQPVRVLTAGVPLLPLPVAALGAGAVGALSYGHEVRYPSLRLLLLPARRRLALLLAKLVVIGVFSALLATATLGLDAGVYAVVLHRVPAPSPALAGFAALVVTAGWIGLLAAGLLRSASAGLLVLLTLPVLVEPAVTALRGGLAGQRTTRALARALWPVGGSRAWLYGPLSGLRDTASLSPRGLVLLVAGPVLLLLLGYLVLLPRRRGV
ncbi:hypothetical protein ACEZCY_34040 [Streptacidiphilus sp. N1-12]|uniref:ABC transporter permease n=2 Tax=Streptacidiphilus alkalitolerans TaxID=3342712 RepID=A0ABV6WR01_9ACTN